jgi:multicomponent Na+:H+ antiporter subunit F
MNEVLNLIMLILVISMGLCFLRLMRGPSMPDRVVALDQIGIHVVALTILYSVTVEQLVFLDAAMIAALLAFLSTVAFARYLEQGKDL